MIAAYFFTAGTVAYFATVLAVRLVTTLIISSIIAKRMADSGDPGTSGASLGNRVQLPPATDNKIGVVYGEAYMKPIITDVKISTDQKTMWYVTVFSEAMDSDSIGTFSFGDIYWGDKKLTFDGTDQTKVVGWVDSSGQNDTKVADKLHFYFYRDGSEKPLNTNLKAWEVLQDSGILEANRWDTSKKMSKLVFAIVKLNYDQDAGITGLADISAVVKNTLTKPGSVIKDYLMNARYGAGLDIARVNTTSLTALDTYSDETISYTNISNTTSTAPRYRINGPVDTTKNFLDNLNQLADCCDSWLSFNEKENNWAIVINRSVYDLDPTGAAIPLIDSSNIMGGINLHPMDLNQSYSSVEIQFPNTRQRDQPGYYRLDIESFPNIVRSDNEPDNSLSIALPFTNNIVEAQYIAGRRLLQSREDLSITFTMDHSGIQIDAGDVIAVTHERYDWDNKFFRVNQVQENKSEDGSLYAQITASEYNDGVYDDNNIDLKDFTLDLNTGITDPNYLPQQGVPTFSNINATSSNPSFDVKLDIPAGGIISGVEFWYSNNIFMADNNYILWGTALPSNGNAWRAGETATLNISGLSNGTYYWRTRLVSLRVKGTFSSPSNQLSWAPNPVGTLVGQNFEAHFTPSNITVRQANTGSTFINLSSIRPLLMGQSGGQVINYSTATTDLEASFVNNSWRIGASTLTNYTSIVAQQVTINKKPTPATNIDGSIYALFDAPTNFQTNVGGSFFMNVPIRYKNNVGEVYQGIPGFQQFQIIRDGTTGTNGVIMFAYLSGFQIEPAQLTQSQLSAAWLTKFNREPINFDCGTFWGPTTHKTYTYYTDGRGWTAAALEIAGDLIATGTVRAAALVASDVYALSYRSLNATYLSTSSQGTWINGTTGDAYFAGDVYIGDQLNVKGIITAGAISTSTIKTIQILKDAVHIGNNVQYYGYPTTSTEFTRLISGSSFNDPNNIVALDTQASGILYVNTATDVTLPLTPNGYIAYYPNRSVYVFADIQYDFNVVKSSAIGIQKLVVVGIIIKAEDTSGQLSPQYSSQRNLQYVATIPGVDYFQESLTFSGIKLTLRTDKQWKITLQVTITEFGRVTDSGAPNYYDLSFVDQFVIRGGSMLAQEIKV